MKRLWILLLGVAVCLMGQSQTGRDCSICSTPVHHKKDGVQADMKDVRDTGVDTAAMVLIKGGKFLMGSKDDRMSDAKPVHEVVVSDFLIDAHEVTNAQFAAFVKATGYITVAEQAPDPVAYPGVPATLLLAGAAVFTPPATKVTLDNALQWWAYVPGANWQQPQGPGSSIVGRDNEPVTQVCYTDAVAYAVWAGKRLPTEAEWEYAARAGSYNRYYWGNEEQPDGKWVANIFQGDFPHKNTREDGFAGVAPVASFPPNAFGLYDMDGNVWEWCADYYRPGYDTTSRWNPSGPADSHDPDELGVVKRVQRGGSFLCSSQYCIRFLAGSRGKGEENSAADNLGFRCVKDIIQ